MIRRVLLLSDMKRAQSSLHNLTIFAQGLSGAGPVTDLKVADSDNVAKAISREFSPEKKSSGGLSVKDLKEGPKEGCGFSHFSDANGKPLSSRSLINGDVTELPPRCKEDKQGNKEGNGVKIDPVLAKLNLDPSMKVVQIDWRFKDGVQKPTYHSLAHIINNHVPFSKLPTANLERYSTEVDELFDNNRRKSNLLPKQKPLPPKRVFTEQEEKILQDVNDGKEFDTQEEMVAAANLHTEYLRNLIIGKWEDDRHLGRKPWMLYVQDENGNKRGIDMYVAYAKQHPEAFNQYHHVWHRLERIHYNPRETFCHTLDDMRNCPY